MLYQVTNTRRDKSHDDMSAEEYNHFSKESDLKGAWDGRYKYTQNHNGQEIKGL